VRLLILGGTGFLGSHLVEAALADGQDVTVFNRRVLRRATVADALNVCGDRERDLALLRGRTWDALVDTCGYLPRVVRIAADALGGAVERYVYLSSIAVYSDFRTAGMTEDAPVASLDNPTEKVTATTYGPLKAACESALAQRLPDRTLIVRPGLIAGPGDPTGRFAYWPLRLARGGDVLVPGPADRRIQFVDARDLATWMLRAIARGLGGVYNVAGPDYPLTMAAFADACMSFAPSDTSIQWVDPGFLLEAGVTPWSELPLWPAPGWEGFVGIDSTRAISAGMRFRPIVETIRDVLVDEGVRPSAGRGLESSRERELIEAWKRLASTAQRA
jgi:2'-hydroxyisoflavone reductase